MPKKKKKKLNVKEFNYSFISKNFELNFIHWKKALNCFPITFTVEIKQRLNGI